MSSHGISVSDMNVDDWFVEPDYGNAGRAYPSAHAEGRAAELEFTTEMVVQSTLPRNYDKRVRKILVEMQEKGLKGESLDEFRELAFMAALSGGIQFRPEFCEAFKEVTKLYGNQFDKNFMAVSAGGRDYVGRMDNEEMIVDAASALDAAIMAGDELKLDAKNAAIEARKPKPGGGMKP